MTQKLTLKQVVKKGIKAFNARTLGVFGDSQLCLYDYEDGKHCIIGNALNVGTMKRIMHEKLNNESLEVLVNEEIVSIESNEYGALTSLQTEHDHACQRACGRGLSTFGAYLNTLAEQLGLRERAI